MGRRRKGRKQSSYSSESDDSLLTPKIARVGGEGDCPVLTVSDIIGSTYSVLYESDDGCENITGISDSDQESNSDERCERSGELFNFVADTMSEGKNASPRGPDQGPAANLSQPSNNDIMVCLKGIESRLSAMDRRLDGLEEVKKKVDNFESEIKKLWLAFEKKTKASEERVLRVEEKCESTDFAMGVLSEKVGMLEKEKDALREEVVYLQSHSMRNNLLFTGIAETQTETSEEVESKLRDFIVQKMKIAQDIVDRMKFERVHRIGPKQEGRGRKIVAKFHEFKEKELVRKQWKCLKGTEFFVSEQFPKDVVEKRRRLSQKMKAARSEGKRAWLAYDTLYIDGKAVRD